MKLAAGLACAFVISLVVIFLITHPTTTTEKVVGVAGIAVMSFLAYQGLKSIGGES